MTIRHVFFDVGGVLGTDGWDHRQRAAAARRFGLDLAEFQDRHEEAVGSWEAGGMTMDEYLDVTVFHRERPFTREDFKAFVFAQSEPFPDVIALARALAGRYRLYTLNNESEELNAYRIDRFGLRGMFTAFFSSCWLRAMKPAPRIYELALAMTQAVPAATVFIDDRERNLDVPRELGMHVIHFENVRALRAGLDALGVRADAS